MLQILCKKHKFYGIHVHTLETIPKPLSLQLTLKCN